MESPRVALITGAYGQDAWYLTEVLRRKSISVVATTRAIDKHKSAHPEAELHAFSLSNLSQVKAAFEKWQPVFCFHLAAHHHSSNAQPRGEELDSFYEANVRSTFHLLTAISEIKPSCRFFYAGSAHMYGTPSISPQNEQTPFLPDTLYGITKVSGANLCRYFRDRHGVFAATGILYNHESPRRSDQFISAKIAKAAALIKKGELDRLVVGNLETIVDWGFAQDYAEAMLSMLEAEKPKDYVIATGQPRRVRDFAKAAFDSVGLSWQDFVHEDPNLVRPAPKSPYVGNAEAIFRDLGWKPKMEFETMVRSMVEHYLKGKA